MNFYRYRESNIGDTRGARTGLFRFPWPDEDSVSPQRRAPECRTLELCMPGGFEHKPGCQGSETCLLTGCVWPLIGDDAPSVLECPQCGARDCATTALLVANPKLDPAIAGRLRGGRGESLVEVLRQESEAREADVRELEARRNAIAVLIEKHRAVLVRKYRRSHVVDEYGTEQDVGWDADLNYFVGKVLNIGKRDPFHATAREFVTKSVARLASEENLTDEEPDDWEADPIAFERYCASLLSQEGWMVHLTKPTFDQGVDIVAEKVRVGSRRCRLAFVRASTFEVKCVSTSRSNSLPFSSRVCADS